jgi:hypothetical protein
MKYKFYLVQVVFYTWFAITILIHPPAEPADQILNGLAAVLLITSSLVLCFLAGIEFGKTEESSNSSENNTEA